MKMSDHANALSDPPASSKAGYSARARERGFSLIELMVAMTITLIITGAMYGFIASGSNAFIKEPSLADRQQQVRIAMNRIQDDILMAGMNLGAIVQTFTPNLDGAGGALGVAAGQNHDVLEFTRQAEDCPQVRLCPEDGTNYAASQDCQPNNGPNTGVVLHFVEPVPACYPIPGFAAILYGDGNSKSAWGHNDTSDSSFNIPPGQAQAGSQIDDNIDIRCSIPAAPGGGPTGTCPTNNYCGTQGTNGILPCAYAIVKLDKIRYQIGIDPADGAPALYRSALGGYNTADPTVYGPPPGDGWQLLGRGIEDMQIRYRSRDAAAAGTDFWSDSAPVIAGSSDRITREVEVTLWARAVGLRNVTGMSTAANGVTAVRGSMTLRVTPRASLDALVGAATNRWQ